MEHLFCVIRPEWMRKYAANTPNSAEAMLLQFSADAFSCFGAIDHARYAHAIHATMRHMKYGIMPRIADSLERWRSARSAAWEDLTLSNSAVVRPSSRYAFLLHQSIAACTGDQRALIGVGEKLRRSSLLTLRCCSSGLTHALPANSPSLWYDFSHLKTGLFHLG